MTAITHKKRELEQEIIGLIKDRIGEEFYVAKDLALSMTGLAASTMTCEKLEQWAKKLKKDAEKEKTEKEPLKT